MPQRPGHKLDLVLVRDAEDVPIWPSDVLSPGGDPGPAAATWIAGGFRRWRFDRPRRTVLYANQQGGFQVRCPVDGVPVIREFAAAMAARDELTEARTMACRCGRAHRLDELTFLPPAAFGRSALILHDVGDASLTETGRLAVDDLLGPLQMIRRRIS